MERPFLPGVNIYLSGTMLGAATDSLGVYETAGIPQGKFVFVASMIGYTARIENIVFDESKVYSFKFSLIPTTYNLDEIRMMDEFDREW